MGTGLINQFKTALILLLTMILLTGLLYPLLITGIAHVCFPFHSNGSFMKVNGKVIGSVFIGQHFTDSKYFWSRPSATQGYPNNALASGASNYALLNPRYLQKIKERVYEIQSADPENKFSIPVTLVTASASGLDPHITPYAAYYQVSRISRLRHIPKEQLFTLISNNIHGRGFDLLGEPRVNVLLLNYHLDELEKNTRSLANAR